MPGGFPSVIYESDTARNQNVSKVVKRTNLAVGVVGGGDRLYDDMDRRPSDDEKTPLYGGAGGGGGDTPKYDQNLLQSQASRNEVKIAG